MNASWRLLGNASRSLLCFFVLGWQLAACAAEEASAWLSPAVPGYGEVRHYPDAAERLDPARSYRLVFDIDAAASAAELVPGLETIARFLNLAALAGVPAGNLQLVAVFHGGATDAVLDAEAYRLRYRIENPNLELIGLLAARGVRLLVCGQALAQMGLDPATVDGRVELAEAALTVLANYQLQGYALMND